MDRKTTRMVISHARQLRGQLDEALREIRLEAGKPCRCVPRGEGDPEDPCGPCLAREALSES